MPGEPHKYWHRRIYYGRGQIYTRTPGNGRVIQIADVAIGDDTDQIGKELTAVWNIISSVNPDDPVGVARALLRLLELDEEINADAETEG